MSAFRVPTILTLAAVLGAGLCHFNANAAEKVKGMGKSKTAAIPYDESQITDQDFFGAMDLTRPGLEAVRKAVEAKDFAAARKATVEYFRTRKTPCWTYDLRGANAEQLKQHFGSAAVSIERAEAMLKNRFVRGRGVPPLDLGPNLDFPNNRTLKKHNAVSLAFHRLYVLGDLATAYLLTRREAFMRKYVELLDKYLTAWPLVWQDRSPGAYMVQRTPVMQEAMSTANRALRWLELLYTDVPYNPHVPVDLTFRMIRSAWFAAWQYRRFDSDRMRPENHHLWERGSAPLQFALLLPEFPGIRPLAERGRAVIDWHTRKDLLPDGGYTEHSIAYTYYTSNMYARPARLARANGADLGKPTMARLRKLFDVTAALALPDGRFPAIGDGGTAAAGPFLKTGEELFDSKRCAAVRRALAPRSGRPDAAALPPLAVCYKQAGYAAGRDAWTPRADAWVMSVNTRGRTGHCHMDMLSLILAVGGQTIIGEPAAELYALMNTPKYQGSALRGHVYNMTAHNTVLVNGAPVLGDKKYGSTWGAAAPVVIEAFDTGDTYTRVRARHAGYGTVRHRRELLFAHRAGWLVVDRVLGGKTNPPHVQRWHFDSGVQVKVLDPQCLFARKKKARLLCVWPARDGVKVRLRRNAALKAASQGKDEDLPWLADVTFATGGSALPVVFLSLDVKPDKELAEEVRRRMFGTEPNRAGDPARDAKLLRALRPAPPK